MRHFPKFVLAAAAALLLAGCAGPRYAQVTASAPAIQPGQGRIYFYDPLDFAGTSTEPNIRLNGKVVGRAKPDSFFFVDRPAGSMVVTTQYWTGAGASFMLDAGETRYVRLIGVNLGNSTTGKLTTELVDDPSEAERQMMPLRYWGAASPERVKLN